MFALDKPLGLSAAQALDAVRAALPALRDQRLGHAGRLDPMAEGLLTVLVGDETRDAPRLRGLDKTYELDVAFGVATDSFDSLGLVTAATPDVTLDPAALTVACRRAEGVVAQRYPPYSQARVDGRSMLAWGPLGVTMDRPVATRTLHAVELVAVTSREGGALVDEAARRTSLPRGDFRQREIADRWRAHARTLADVSLPVASLRVTCSAGTYMRSLAVDLGAALGLPSMAWRIRRVRAGDLTLDDAVRLEPSLTGAPCEARVPLPR